ncbi:MAG: phosphotransferase [bacterium]|nr:phosphotransferase [bacterium]
MTAISDIDGVIKAVPLLATAATLDVAPLEGGLSNLNYLVTADSDRFVVRVAAGSDEGWDRRGEREAVRLAKAAGIAPEVVALLPGGHSVVRFIESAQPLTVEELRDRAMLDRVGLLLRTIHGLGPIAASFSPYDETRRMLEMATSMSYPNGLQRLLDRNAETERRRDGSFIPVLCHNDPYHLNILLDGDRLWMIDWEYSGMNDPMYDLAGVGYLQDDVGKVTLLESYFGESTSGLSRDLDDMIAVYLGWNVAWSLVQAKSSQIDFDYVGFVDELMTMVPD